MSGIGTDYTTTPNLGLFKPIYDRDVEMWGTHLNSNADVLDAALSTGTGGMFLPLSGGTMTGPLNYTATGGSVSRSAQDRMADYVNVLDYGADPTNTADSTAAIQAALNTRKNVYMPKGKYLITNMLTMKTGQKLFGDGPSTSMLATLSTTFNMSAVGMVNMNPGDPANYGEANTSLENMGFFLSQPDVSVRASITPYPPCIVANGANRFRILHVLIWNGNIGLDVSQGGVGLVHDFQCGTLTCGIKWGNCADGVEISNFHFWNFGIPANGNLWNVYSDGHNTAAQLARIDGLMATNWECFCGRVTINDPGGRGWYEFTNLMLDGQSGLDVATAQWCHITNCYQVQTSTAPAPSINITGGFVYINNLNVVNGSTSYPAILTAGASTELQIVNGVVSGNFTNFSPVQVTGGKLLITNSKFNLPGAMTVPFIAQTAGILVCRGNYFGSNGTGVGISVLVDSPGNIVSGNVMQQMACVFPTTNPIQGTYSNYDGTSAQQLLVGGSLGTAYDGQVQFTQGNTGNTRGYAGFMGDSATVALVNTMGSGGTVALNNNSVPGTVSLRVGGTEYLRVTNTGLTLTGATAITGATTFSAPFNVTAGGNSSMGSGVGSCGLTLNGGGGAARGITVESGGTTIFTYGATNASDWGINRYVSGTATDFPITVRGATGQIEMGIGNADTIIGKQAGKALTETTGFLAIPWCNGTPTGVPTNNTKGICMVFDTSAFKLWAYAGGTWKGVVLA